jgi:hypothetical protein
LPLHLHESSLCGDDGELLELVHDVTEPVFDLPTNPISGKW